jgi:hypothetical protein
VTRCGTTVKPEQPPRVTLRHLPEDVGRKLLVRGGGGGSPHWFDGGWLPGEGPLAAHFADRRREHHRLLARLADSVDELQDLEREWVEQDQSRAEALREAHRKAGTKAVKNDRTPEPERRERRAAMLDSIRAGAEVVIEFGRETVAWIRRNEDALLAELRGEPLREVERKPE